MNENIVKQINDFVDYMQIADSDFSLSESQRMMLELCFMTAINETLNDLNLKK